MSRLSAVGILFISLLSVFYGWNYLYTKYGIIRLEQRQPLESTPFKDTNQTPYPSFLVAELNQIAKSQLEPWIGFQMNISNVQDYVKRKSYIYVVEINNGSMHIPEYVDRELDLNKNVEPLVSVIQEILLEENDIRDTILFLNLLDEPRNPNKTRCQQTGTWTQIEKYHGFPLSYVEKEDEPWFPVLSPATISNCFHDILVPFGDTLEPVKLAEMRNSASTRQHCEWDNKNNNTKRLWTAIFRGRLTGHSVQQGRNHRLALVHSCDNEQSRYVRNYLANSSGESYSPLFSLFPDGGPLCDAAFSQQITEFENITSLIASDSYFLPMQVWEQITFLILDIDGNSYSRRLANLCFADVDIIRLGIFQDLLLMLLKNGTHYRHIQIDNSDLFSTLRYMRTNLTYSQQLCHNKQQRCRQVLDYRNMKYYIKTLLEEYSRQVSFVS